MLDPELQLAKLEHRQAKKWNRSRQYQINKLRDAIRLAAFAREHREQPTRAEAALDELLTANLPFPFKAQEVIGRRIADFVIPAHKLIIEVDGPYHASTIKEDRKRTQELNEHGYRVVRFTNDQVLNEPHFVLAAIMCECGKAYELASDAYPADALAA